MLVIRLLRTGRKHQPFFKVVVCDKKNPPQAGRFVEVLGYFNPLTKEKNFKTDRIKYWLSVGAQPSDTVNNFLVGEKIIEGNKANKFKLSKKKREETKNKKQEAGDKNQEETDKIEEKPEETEEEKPVEEAPKEEVKPEKAEEEKPAEEAPKEEAKPEKAKDEKKTEK